MDGSIEQMPGKRTNREYEMQGWNAALRGHDESLNPYLPTSTAWERWRKGNRSVSK